MTMVNDVTNTTARDPEVAQPTVVVARLLLS